MNRWSPWLLAIVTSWAAEALGSSQRELQVPAAPAADRVLEAPSHAQDAGDTAAVPRGNPTVPAWFPRAPSLPPPRGEVLHVATVSELYEAVERVGVGGTILLADGDYRLLRPVVFDGKRNIALRSASGDPARVTLRGQGWQHQPSGDDLVHIARCAGVTLADLTFADCRSYGIKVEAENAPRDIHIYHCRFRDIGVRAIKGSAGKDPEVRAVNGSVRYCDFENTRIPPAEWLFGGDYIAAIDMMALENWTFSDNVFRHIQGRRGGGRAAIFIWVRSRQIVVERNLVLNCDRGIALGNPGESTANLAGERLVYVADAVIRNNFIAGGPDCGIELWHVERVQVLHNSIWRPERNWSRGIRVGTGTTQTALVNNLVHGEIRFEGGEAEATNNLAGRLDGYFVDPETGNLALTRKATGAIDQGAALPEVPEDISGRARTGLADLGAWEWREDL
ncbi:MAG: right-handed parallel beta-helix repeat-containing protein [Verrucomicrobiales bacterium]|nr:right-handed parallel beta-helix repeat-containing protein [Verrucomicrobiales bacterium]